MHFKLVNGQNNTGGNAGYRVSSIFMPESWHGTIGPNNDNKATEAARNGTIGFPILSKFNLLLDPINSKVILVNPSHKPMEYDVQKWISIPFDEHLSTQLKMNGRLVTLVWDTGSMPSVISRSIANYFNQENCSQNNQQVSADSFGYW